MKLNDLDNVWTIDTFIIIIIISHALLVVLQKCIKKIVCSKFQKWI